MIDRLNEHFENGRQSEFAQMPPRAFQRGEITLRHLASHWRQHHRRRRRRRRRRRHWLIHLCCILCYVACPPKALFILRGSKRSAVKYAMKL